MMNAPTTPRLPEHRKRVVVVSSEKFRPPNVALTRRMQQQQQQQQPGVANSGAANAARRSSPTTPLPRETEPLDQEHGRLYSRPKHALEREEAADSAAPEGSTRIKKVPRRSVMASSRGRSAKREKTEALSTRGSESRIATRKTTSTGIQRRRSKSGGRKTPLGRQRIFSRSSSAGKRRGSRRGQTRDGNASSGDGRTVPTVKLSEKGNEEEQKEDKVGPSALSMADRVVTEYERLLEAMPVMVRHMGRLQGETEVMGQGLEKRIRDLLIGYRELNDLAEQAPLYVTKAASDYAQSLGGHPHRSNSPGASGGQQQEQTQRKLDIEAIHRELHVLREAKIALDKAVALSSSEFECSSNGVSDGRSGRRSTTFSSSTRNATKRIPLYLRPPAVAVAGGRQGASHDRRARPENYTAAVGSAGSARGRRAPLAEVQIDPDMPLPLPAFPGYLKLFSRSGDGAPGGADEKFAGKNSDRRYLYPTSNGSGNIYGGGGGTGNRSTQQHHHGLFVPGVVPSRQRQSHGLPQDLRAIFSVPKPERGPGNPPAVKLRAPRRPKPAVAPATALMNNPGGSPLLFPSKVKPPTKRQGREDQDNGGGGGDDRNAVNPRPRYKVGVVPGSAAATAAAREQRKRTGKALEELRNEMREREERLMAEFERFRKKRAQRSRAGAGSRSPDFVASSGGGGGGGGEGGDVSKARISSMAGRRSAAHQRSTATSNRASLADRQRRPRSSASHPSGRRFNLASAYGSKKRGGVVTWAGRDSGGRNNSNRGNVRAANSDNNKKMQSYLAPVLVRGMSPAQPGDRRTVSESTPADGISGAVSRSSGEGCAGDDKQRAGGDKGENVQKTDAQAQTAMDVMEGAHIFLPPAPAPPAGFLEGERGEEDAPRSGKFASESGRDEGFVPAAAAVAADGVPVVDAVGRSEGDGGGETGFERDGYFVDVAGYGEVIPRPPVVFIEGGGRNMAWHPSDDDRLLSGRVGGGGGGGEGLSEGRLGLSQGGEPDSASGAVEEGHPNPPIGGGEAPSNDEMRLNSASSPTDGFSADCLDPKPISITTAPPTRPGLELPALPLQLSSSVPRGVVEENENKAVDDDDDDGDGDKDDSNDQWVDVGGMLRLAAAVTIDESTTVPAPAPAPDTVPVAVAATEGGEQDDRGPTGALAVSVVAPQLLELMREVVGQQRGLGEERSALMQALRGEMESRRALLANQEISLANQEISLREREAAISRREAHSAAVVAAAVTAAVTEDAVDEEETTERQGHQGRQSSAVTESQDENSRGREQEGLQTAGVLETGNAGTEEEEEEKEQEGKANQDKLQQPDPGGAGGGSNSIKESGHIFRSSLGRILAGGSGWAELPLDETRSPGKNNFSTSFGRMLAGGPAWQQLPLGEEEARKKGPDGRPMGVGEGERNDRRTGTGSAARDDSHVQELLRAAERGPHASATAAAAAAVAAAGGASYSTLFPGEEVSAATESGRLLESSSSAELVKKGSLEDQERSELLSKGSDEAISVVNTGVQTERGVHCTPSPALEHASTRQSASAAARVGGFSGGGNRLELSLATAVLSVAQRLGDVETRAAETVAKAEDAARDALQEVRRESNEGQDRQSKMLLRLEEMDQASCERAQVLTRELAKLREEGRLARERAHVTQVSPARPQPRSPFTPPYSWIGTSESDRTSSSKRSNQAGVSEIGLGGHARPWGFMPPRPGPLSPSRSSFSEGQIQGGSFSDGELVRLTPRGRHVVEEGELVSGLPKSPSPVVQQTTPHHDEGETLRNIRTSHRRGREREGSSSDAAAAAAAAGLGHFPPQIVVNADASVDEGARRSTSREGGPKEHLAMLMSAYPSIDKNRGRLRAAQVATAAVMVAAPAAADAAAVLSSCRSEGNGDTAAEDNLRRPFSGTVTPLGESERGEEGEDEEMEAGQVSSHGISHHITKGVYGVHAASRGALRHAREHSTHGQRVRTQGREFQGEVGGETLVTGYVDESIPGSQSDSTWSSCEPGQVHNRPRSVRGTLWEDGAIAGRPRHNGLSRGNDDNDQCHRRSRGNTRTNVDDVRKQNAGAWYRRWSGGADGSTPSSCSNNVDKEVGSGAERGEFGVCFADCAGGITNNNFNQGLPVSERPSLEAVGGRQQAPPPAGEANSNIPRSRPLVPLKVRGSSESTSADPARSNRRGRAEIDRAVAEAELDFHTNLATYRTHRAAFRDAAGLPSSSSSSSSDEHDAKCVHRNAHHQRGTSSDDSISWRGVQDEAGGGYDAEQRIPRSGKEREENTAEEPRQGSVRDLVDAVGMRESKGGLEPGEIG